MPQVPTTNISMSAINAEQAGVDSTNLRVLSTTGAITTGQAIATLDGTAPHSMNEFAGYLHTSIGSFPSLSDWDTFNQRQVSSGSYDNAQCFCSMSFNNEQSNNRVKVTYYGGTNAAFATIYTKYIDYTGYTGTIKVQYNSTGSFFGNPGTSYSYPPFGWPGHASNSTTISVNNSGAKKDQATDYDIPTSGDIQFKWLVVTNASRYQSQQRYTTHLGVTFKVSFTSGGDVYDTTSSSKNIENNAIKGMSL